MKPFGPHIWHGLHFITLMRLTIIVLALCALLPLAPLEVNGAPKFLTRCLELVKGKQEAPVQELPESEIFRRVFIPYSIASYDSLEDRLHRFTDNQIGWQSWFHSRTGLEVNDFLSKSSDERAARYMAIYAKILPNSHLRNLSEENLSRLSQDMQDYIAERRQELDRYVGLHYALKYSEPLGETDKSDYEDLKAKLAKETEAFDDRELFFLFEEAREALYNSL